MTMSFIPSGLSEEPYNASRRFRRASSVIDDELDGHAVLLDQSAVTMLTLNRVGTLVWQLLDDDRAGAELPTLLLPKVRGVTAEQLDLDVEAFLQDLVDAGVVVTCDEPS